MRPAEAKGEPKRNGPAPREGAGPDRSMAVGTTGATLVSWRP
jgi:hypothetical protein